MKELFDAGGPGCAADQILYNLGRRGPEIDLIPWLAGRSVPVMAYSPIEQGKLASHRDLARIARGIGATPAQIALAWLLRQPGVIAIPKASSRKHVQENQGAADLMLDEDDIAALDAAFPKPARRRPLEML